MLKWIEIDDNFELDHNFMCLSILKIIHRPTIISKYARIFKEIK